MITTLRTNFKNPVRRKMMYARMGGKMIGLAVVIGMIYAFAYLFSTQVASATPVHSAATDLKAQLQGTINGLNTVWVCVTAFLVFFMQAGFMMLEGGFARTREVSNVMIECIVDTALCGMLFYAFGFAFMFGPGNGWIGYHYFFLQGVPHTYTYGSSTPASRSWRSSCSSSPSPTPPARSCRARWSVAPIRRRPPLQRRGERVHLPDLRSLGLGSRRLAGQGRRHDLGSTTPFRDFAGSTVVHTVGGVLALTGAIALGPRLGRKFKRDGGGMPPGHNMTLAALGGVILWFGWYGFNPGSTLSAMDFEGIGRVATNTTLAACAGALVGGGVGLPPGQEVGRRHHASTACSPDWSRSRVRVTGCRRSVRSPSGRSRERSWCSRSTSPSGSGSTIPCGAFAVHGVCGIWGTLSLGLFATGNYGHPAFGAEAACFYGGGTNQLVAQIIGSAVVTAAHARRRPAAHVRRQGARHPAGLAEDGELEGLDIHEHGAPAYHPEYAYMGYSPLPPSVEAAADATVSGPPSDIHLPTSD